MDENNDKEKQLEILKESREELNKLLHHLKEDGVMLEKNGFQSESDDLKKAAKNVREEIHELNEKILEIEGDIDE